MPYPPKKSESNSEYMKKCIKGLMKEGKSYSKAKDICYAVWLQHKKKKRK